MALALAQCLIPAWGAPAGVAALSTTRTGGVSRGSWGLAGGGPGGLNLGTACGDDPAAVRANRARLRALLPAAPIWLQQVHGVTVFRASAAPCGEAAVPVADAAVTASQDCVLAIQTADCLPVLFADARARAVGAAHAGWRGLDQGVLEATVAAMQDLGADVAGLHTWVGPGIGPGAFEIGAEVRASLLASDPGAEACFQPLARHGKWLADLPRLAVRRLRALGVEKVTTSGLCTAGDARRFYSYRRDRHCGRMASLIWIRAR